MLSKAAERIRSAAAVLRKLASDNRAQSLHGRTVNGIHWVARHRLILAGGVSGVFAAGALFGFIVYAIDAPEKKKKIVVLGSGWGAVSFIKSLKPGQFNVAVVSPENYFMFSPLLPSVTVGTVEGRSITEPIRKIISRRHRSNARFYESICTDIDVEGKKVKCQDISGVVGSKKEFELDYDFLVVAVGADSGTFNIPGVKENTHFLKNVQDAQRIRENIVDAFETAAIPGQPDEEVRRLLHFVVVGGGPSGVEFAAELQDFVHEDMRKHFPPELADKVQITLLDGLKRLLNSYDDLISRYTEEKFKRSGINVMTNTFVTGVEKERIRVRNALSKEEAVIPYGMCVWCAGLAPREITKKLQEKIPGQNHRCGLISNKYLRVKNTDRIFAVGDCTILQFDKAAEKVEELFKEADVNKDGTLSFEEFQDILEKAMQLYPHLCHHFAEANRKSMKAAFQSADKDSNLMLTLDEFREFLRLADLKSSSLPPTAQVAAQEGTYLAQLFNMHATQLEEGNYSSIKPFHYHHLGSFTYVGDNRAVLELPVIGSFKGWSIMWLWRAVYTSYCVSLRMRVLILFDWIKTYIFGRDTSRI